MTTQKLAQTSTGRRIIKVDRRNAADLFSGEGVRKGDVLNFEGTMELVCLAEPTIQRISTRWREQRSGKNFISYTSYKIEGNFLYGWYLEGLRLEEGTEEYSNLDLILRRNNL